MNNDSEFESRRIPRIKTERDGGCVTLSFNTTGRYVVTPQDTVSIIIPNISVTDL